MAVWPDVVLAIEGGAENSFTTTALPSDNDGGDNDGDNDSDHEDLVSGEHSFTTEGGSGSNPDKPLVVSEEVTFTSGNTGFNPDLDKPLVVSNELSFTTTSPNLDPEVVSGENQFTTLAEPNNPGGGGNGNNDNNGDSSGRRRSRGGSQEEPTIAILPSCAVWITDFIKLGAVNDREQVIRLQLFLRHFEGFEVPVSGYYDETTYQAVRLFQQRYAGAILAPWGISQPTGYVYITTTLAINSRVCRQSLNHNIDLRNFYPKTVAVGVSATDGMGGEKGFSVTPFATSTVATSTSPVIDQVATTALGVAIWFKSYLCPIVIGLLLILIGWLWWRIEALKKRLRDLDPPSLPLPAGPPDRSGAGGPPR